MKIDEALKVVAIALMNYVDDSSGEGTEKTIEIQKAFDLVKSNSNWNEAFIKSIERNYPNSYESACAQADEDNGIEVETEFDNWTCTELFDHAIDNDLIDEDDEFEDWINKRVDLLDLAKENAN
jgi:hypothetical protein